MADPTRKDSKPAPDPATKVEPTTVEPTTAQAESTLAGTGETYGDDSYTVEQLISAPDLFEPGHVGPSEIQVSLQITAPDRKFWTLEDARGAVDALLSHKAE